MTIGFVLSSVVLYSWLFLLAGLQIYRLKDGTENTFCGLSQDVNLFGLVKNLKKQVQTRYFQTFQEF